MQYMCLIYGDEKSWATMDEPQRGEVLKAYFDYDAAVKAAGVFVAGDALQDTSNASTVRMQDGKLVTTDGPFAETKEQLGGYYLLECKTREEALEWAAKIPASKHGSVEVRPVMVFDDPNA